MTPTTHVRQHNSVLAAAEKRALIWIAQRLPRWINSDHLSALGLLAMAGAGASFVIAHVPKVPRAAFEFRLCPRHPDAVMVDVVRRIVVGDHAA